MTKEVIEIALRRGTVLVDSNDYKNLPGPVYLVGKSALYAELLLEPAPHRGRKKRVYLHRWLMGAKHGEVVDHVNGNKLDNRRCNLRLCSVRQNCQNRRVGAGSSGFKGVRRFPWGKYHARIKVGGVEISLGYFSSANDAAKAYDAAARKYFGEFAATNFTTT